MYGKHKRTDNFQAIQLYYWLRICNIMSSNKPNNTPMSDSKLAIRKNINTKYIEEYINTISWNDKGWIRNILFFSIAYIKWLNLQRHICSSNKCKKPLSYKPICRYTIPSDDLWMWEIPRLYTKLMTADKAIRSTNKFTQRI